MEISIVIPVLDNWVLTGQCLKSIAQNTAGDAFEVIVADNGSRDETRTACPALGTELFGPRFRYIRLETNQNFGPACNLGAKQASGRYLFFLNNDTLVTAGWEAPLLDAFRTEPGLGAAGPLLLYPDSDRVQHLGISFDPVLSAQHLYEHFPADHPLIRKRRKLKAITAAALMIPKDLFDALGGFHEEYVNGFEDMDLCLRLSTQGKELTCIPESVVHHYGSRTPGRFDKDDTNGALLSKRCGSLILPDLHAWADEDGYRLRVTPWLSFYVGLTPERNDELNRQFQGKFDPQQCLDALHYEPLWIGGYELIALHFEKHKEWMEALEARLDQTTFWPTAHGLKNMHRVATAAGDHGYADICLQQKDRFESLASDTQFIETVGRQILDRIRKLGDRRLDAVYNEIERIVSGRK